VALEQNDGSINLNLEYMKDVFRADTVALVAQYYLTLIAAVLQNVDQKVSVLPQSELQTQFIEQILQYNATSKEIPNTSVTRYCKVACTQYAANNAGKILEQITVLIVVIRPIHAFVSVGVPVALTLKK
jgi:hypothetical protein